MTTPSRELKRRARCVLEGKYFFASNAACSLMLYSFTAAIILQYTGLGTSEKPVGIAFYYILWLITALLGSLFEVGLIRYVYLLSRKKKEPVVPVLFYAYKNQPDTFILVYAFRYLLALVHLFLQEPLHRMLLPVPGLLAEAGKSPTDIRLCHSFSR